MSVRNRKKGHNWLTFTTARGEQLSQTAGGCRCIDGRKRGSLSPGGASCPQSSSLLFVLPSDPCNSHLLWDWEAVGHGDRGQRRVHWVRHVRVAQRVAGSLGVCVPCVRVAMSLMHRALGHHGGGSVSDDSGGHANRCAVTKLVAWQWVQKRNAWGGRLLSVGGVCYRNRWISVRLMSIQHGTRCDARSLVFTASRVRSGLARSGIRWGRLRQTVRWQSGLGRIKKDWSEQKHQQQQVEYFCTSVTKRSCLQEQYLSQLVVDE